jgi:large subunit ribosomal protein L6
MSKIGKQPIDIPSGVTVAINGQEASVSGTKGNASYVIPNGIKVAVADAKVIVSQEAGKEELTKALFGLTRAYLANLIKGVSIGFEKKLELSGVGYRAQMAGSDITLSIGFSHPVKIAAPKGIQFAITDNVISVSGIDTVLVGNTAANIRKIRPPEPYKGKGIKYVGEVIRKKAGKAAKAVGGAGAK